MLEELRKLGIKHELIGFNNNLRQFTGGSSYRDWQLLVDVAKEMPNTKFFGIARKAHFPNAENSFKSHNEV